MPEMADLLEGASSGAQAAGAAEQAGAERVAGALAARRDWMSVLAKAPVAALAQRWAACFAQEPAFDWLRPPEVGAVMVRGRAGATGAPFNLGEMSVTRCAVKLADGSVGHGYVQGRDKKKARIAALVDAVMQRGAVGSEAESAAEAERVRVMIVDPLAQELADLARVRAEKAAATKVEFFTMARGED